ncbi:MAG: hypothetical protein IJJ25_09175 [Lachnospiraceae bacterium]|nr:hypothetical protein [Lachnospiraceae bacterium]
MYKDIWNRSIWKKEEERPARIEDYSGDIEELGLSVRSFNCLKRAGCHKISDVLKILEDDEEGLRKIRNLGTRSENEIKESLAHYQEICGSPTQSPAGSNAGTKYKLIVPAKKVWDTEIERYGLSDRAMRSLKRKGVNRIRDLYSADLPEEPGWYAVRELLDKIPAGQG